jgi:hypothetical protein
MESDVDVIEWMKECALLSSLIDLCDTMDCRGEDDWKQRLKIALQAACDMFPKAPNIHFAGWETSLSTTLHTPPAHPTTIMI